MIVTLLFVLGGVCTVAAVGILLYLYYTREQRHLGLARDGRTQGIQLIIWFLFLGILVNVILRRLVEILGNEYVFVLLPILLLMVACMLFILYRKAPEEQG